MYRVMVLKADTGAIVTTRYYETLDRYTAGLQRLISHKGHYYRIVGHQLIQLANMQWYTLTDRPPDNSAGPPEDNHFT